MLTHGIYFLDQSIHTSTMRSRGLPSGRQKIQPFLSPRTSIGRTFCPSIQIDSKTVLYRIQIGAFSVKSNAEQLRDRLKSLSFDAFITTADPGSAFYRFQAGAYRRRTNAAAAQKKLLHQGFSLFLAAS